MKLASCDRCFCVIDIDKAEASDVDSHGNLLNSRYGNYVCPVCDDDITVELEEGSATLTMLQHEGGC